MTTEVLRICSRCGESKPADTTNFYSDKNRTGGLSSRCKPCAREVTKEWKLANPERWAAYRAQPYDRDAHLAARRAKSKRYYQEHPEAREQDRLYRRKWRAENAEGVRRRTDRWFAEYSKLHPERVKDARAEINHKRRARILATTIGPIDYDYLWHIYGGACHICGTSLERLVAEWDHVIPLSKGGTHTQENLAPAHDLCNQKKGQRLNYPLATIQLTLLEI